MLVILGFWLAGQFVQPAPPKTIVMAAGQPGGAYMRYAERYRHALAAYDITLEIRESKGSVDNLERLLREEDPVDIALVQGGVALPEQQLEMSRSHMNLSEPTRQEE
ncbi:hypothetical protein, partial [Thiohalocapsa sp.]|uniref:hypothetical protein n=1 Tax=Thiohalocapsa sp. TaxID=2497641 RepID=UPI0025D8398F